MITKDVLPDEPRLVRANPGEWPELWLPEEWPVERRAAFAARWAGMASTVTSPSPDPVSITGRSTTLEIDDVAAGWDAEFAALGIIP